MANIKEALVCICAYVTHTHTHTHTLNQGEVMVVLHFSDKKTVKEKCYLSYQ